MLTTVNTMAPFGNKVELVYLQRVAATLRGWHLASLFLMVHPEALTEARNL